MKVRELTATITGFSTNEDDTLTVFFLSQDKSRKLRTLAHPALAHRDFNEEKSPIALMVNVETTLKIAETEQGWKMIQPLPTQQRIKAYEEAKKLREALEPREATAEELKLLCY